MDKEKLKDELKKLNRWLQYKGGHHIRENLLEEYLDNYLTEQEEEKSCESCKFSRDNENPEKILKWHLFPRACFSPDNKYIISAGQDKLAILWDIENKDIHHL